MELLFVAILPGWTFAKNGGVTLPEGLPQRLIWRLMLTVAVCDAYALLRHGRLLRLLTARRRQLLVQSLATHPWPWLRHSLALARNTALLAGQRRIA